MGADTVERMDSARRRQAAGDLRGRLRDFGKRRRAVAGMRGAFWMLALLGFGLLAVAWVDLLVDVPALLRVAGMAAALVVGVGAMAATLVATRRTARPMQVARDVDRLAGSAGQVAAGLDLTEMPPQTRPLTKALAGMAVGRAAAVVWAFPEDAVGPLRSVRGAALGTAAAVCVLVAFGALWPSAFNTESARLADPWGDHPAYSRYAFTVRPGDTQVLYGAGLAVETDVKGPPLERLNLVVRQPSGAEEALPMFSERSGSWRVHLTDIGEPLTYWVSAGRARSPRYHVAVKTTPQIEQLTVRTEPPAYTNLPAVEGAMPDGGISGLPGTRVTLTARSNRPLSVGQVQLDLADGTQRTLSAKPHADDAKSASMDFTIEQAGQLTLSVVDAAGEPSDSKIKAPILLLKDERPFVRIIEPKPESFATPDVPLPVVLDAEDDYGISALSVYRALNGSRHLPEKLMVPLPAGRNLERTAYLTLADYGLEAGDLITIFGRAEDTDPAGAKGAESTVVRVNIISRELYEDLTRAQQTADAFEKKYDEAARRLEALKAAADDLSKQLDAEKGDKVSEQTVSKQTQKKLDDFAQQLKKASEATEQAADQEPLYALDKDLTEPLRKMADAMANAGEEVSKAAQDAKSGTRAQTAESLELAKAMLGNEQSEYEEAVEQPLDKFMKAYALLEMQERFIELADKQRDLAERSAELKGRDGTDDPALKARMRDLRDEERANQEELNTILQEIRNHATELPDDPDLAELKDEALDFADAVEASRAKPSLAEAGDALDAFHGTEAQERATEAADVLESFISKCMPKAGQNAKLAFGPTRMQAAGMTAQQLLTAAGLGMQQGEGGRGSGAGGYSTRTGTLNNVGLYGPARRGEAGGGENAHQTAGASGEPVGGSGVAGLTTGPGASGASEALPLQALPPQHREGVRAYFRSVAEETSAGKVTEPPAPKDNRQPQLERGTR